ncbi:MAG: HlyD family efflux transporter periplasmic adaptor subunit [Planctomycetales bacterium]|nr:HlyD family efflux transporter periplasmic adaptor subunit [Planctomycetales bacterium]
MIRNHHIQVSIFLFIVSVLPNLTCADIYEGFTEPKESTSVSAAVTERIQNVLVTRGQVVRRDDVLVQLEDRILQQDRRLAELRANDETLLQAAKEKLRHAEAEHTQFLNAHRDAMTEKRIDPTTPKERQNAEHTYKISQVELESVRLDLKRRHHELQRIDAEIELRTVRSPTDGIIQDILKKPGELASVADPVLITIVNLSELRATFFIPYQLVSQLECQQSVPIRIRDDLDVHRTATIEFISPLADPATGEVEITVLIPNEELDLRAGTECFWDWDPAETEQQGPGVTSRN